MRMVKIRSLLYVILLIAVCWLGYWIGYISSKPTEAENLLAVQYQQDPNQWNSEKKPIHGRIKDLEPSIRGINHVQGLHHSHVGHIIDHLHPKASRNLTQKKEHPIPLKDNNQDDGVEWKHLLKLKEEQEKKTQLETLKEKQKDKTAERTQKENQVAPIPVKMAKFDPADPYYAVIHDGVATRVHGKIHEKLQTLPDTVPKEAYIFEADKLPENPRLRPSIGNGHLGTVIHGPNVFMNGLYNGLGDTSHRAAIPSSCSFNITGTQPQTNFTRKYRLNVGEGVYSEVSEGPGFTLTQRMYAHRNISQLLVVEVDLVRREQPTNTTLPQKLIIKLNKWKPSYDLTFAKYDSGMDKVSYKVGTISGPEQRGESYSEAHVLYDQVPDTLEILAETPRIKWVFLTSIAHNKQSAFQAYIQGSALVKHHDALYAQHVEAWAGLWRRGRVDVLGNLQISRAVYGSWYYIFCSMPVTPQTVQETSKDDKAEEDKVESVEGKKEGIEDKAVPEEEFVGLSPSGLPYGNEDDDYMGHVFWDQETWMYPPILLLRPDLAHRLLLTRQRTQAAAAQYAKDTGFQGLRYPWESARSGFDVTPDKNCSVYELHINGDISLAIVQYLYATNDTSLITQQHFDEIITGIANFWVSKLRQNTRTLLYEIHDVMPPDEDCIKVNNSVYTNEVARIALSAPEYIFSLVGKKETHWKEFADNIYMPFDEKYKYHPEYDGYKYGSTVKQADVIMLGYPLQRKMPPEIRLNDMNIYAKVMNKKGPAMTWPMYCIGWLEVKELKKAEEDFMKSFDYIHTEFQVWTEVLGGPDKGATNFLTGMGGFLQSIMFGYGGIRLLPDRLNLDPELPPSSTELHIIGLSYLGNVMDVFVTASELMVTVTSRGRIQGDGDGDGGAELLHLEVYSSGAIHDLNVKQPVTVKRQKCAIFKAVHEETAG